MTKLSISQAAQKWNKSRTTLYRAMNGGVLSSEGKGKSRRIDASEMIRVYGETRVNTTEKTNVDSDVQITLLKKNHNIALLEQKIQHLNEMIELKDKEIQTLKVPKELRLITWYKQLKN